ncbi:hypothetical protein DRQ33_07395, partial [bacterium]
EDWFDFSVELAKNNENWDSIEYKLRFADRIAPYISILGDSLTGGLYRKKLAEILGVGEKRVNQRIARATKRSGQTYIETADRYDESTKDVDIQPDARTELDLIAMIISNPMLAEVIEKSAEIELVLYRGVMEQVLEEIKNKGECSPELLVEFLEGRALSYLTRTILGFSEMPTHTDVMEHIKIIKCRNIEFELADLHKQLMDLKSKDDKTLQKTNEILSKISELKRKKVELSSPHSGQTLEG